MLSLWAVRALERCLRLVHTWSSPLLPEGPLAAELQLVGAGLAAMCCARPLTRTLTRTLTLTLPVPVPVRLPVPVPLALTAALRLARYCVWLAYLLLRMARRLHLLDARSRVAYYLSGATACVTLSGLTAAELSPGEQGVPSLFAGLALASVQHRNSAPRTATLGAGLPRGEPRRPCPPCKAMPASASLLSETGRSTWRQGVPWRQSVPPSQP